MINIIICLTLLLAYFGYSETSPNIESRQTILIPTFKGAASSSLQEDALSNSVRQAIAESNLFNVCSNDELLAVLSKFGSSNIPFITSEELNRKSINSINQTPFQKYIEAVRKSIPANYILLGTFSEKPNKLTISVIRVDDGRFISSTSYESERDFNYFTKNASTTALIFLRKAIIGKSQLDNIATLAASFFNHIDNNEPDLAYELLSVYDKQSMSSFAFSNKIRMRSSTINPKYITLQSQDIKIDSTFLVKIKGKTSVKESVTSKTAFRFGFLDKNIIKISKAILTYRIPDKTSFMLSFFRGNSSVNLDEAFNNSLASGDYPTVSANRSIYVLEYNDSVRLFASLKGARIQDSLEKAYQKYLHNNISIQAQIEGHTNLQSKISESLEDMEKYPENWNKEQVDLLNESVKNGIDKIDISVIITNNSMDSLFCPELILNSICNRQTADTSLITNYLKNEVLPKLTFLPFIDLKNKNIAPYKSNEYGFSFSGPAFDKLLKDDFCSTNQNINLSLSPKPILAFGKQRRKHWGSLWDMPEFNLP